MSNFKKILKFIWNEFIYGGHLQSLSAMSIIFVSGTLLKIQITWDLLFIVYLVFYVPYLHNRFKEINVDYLTNVKRTRHLRKYLKFVPIIFYFASFVLVINLIYFSNFLALIFGLLLLIFGIFYTTVFKKVTKKICLFKNIYVSIFFALLPFFLAVYYSCPLTNFLVVGVLVFAMFVFLKSFITQMFFDVKDVESDRKEGLCTFPIIMGKEKSIVLLSLFDFIITATMPISFFYLNIFSEFILILILTIPFDFYCYSLVKKKKYFGYILKSGEFFLWLFLIFVGKIIL